MRIGVRSKEVFAMVVDMIIAMLPEIVCMLVSALIKEPITMLIGMLFSD